MMAPDGLSQAYLREDNVCILSQSDGLSQAGAVYEPTLSDPSLRPKYAPVAIAMLFLFNIA